MEHSESSGTRSDVSPPVDAVVREADREMRRLGDGGRYQLYNHLHITMSRMWRVDSFHIAFFQDGNVVAFPYNFDGNGYRDPHFHIYGKNDMCAWMIEQRRPYTFSLDQGALLRRGSSFPQARLKSKDAVAVPLMVEVDGVQRVAGQAAIQSYHASSYDGGTVSAFWRLAQTMMNVITRQRAGSPLRPATSRPSADGMSLPELVEEISGKFRLLRHGIDHIRHVTAGAGHDIRRAVQDVSDICDVVQTETFELLVQPAEKSSSLLSRLTPREREVAALVAQGRNNKEIARALYITELTAKTHVSRILRKFGVNQRAEIAILLRSLSDLYEARNAM